MADFYAVKVLEEAGRRGIRIPGDLSLVGIDNTPDCETCRPRLTSVDQPLEGVCKAAVSMVIDPQKEGSGHCSSMFALNLRWLCATPAVRFPGPRWRFEQGDYSAD